MTVVAEWTCPSCGTLTGTPYCPTCGERPQHARDLTLRGLLDQAVEALTNVDGRVLRSLRCLVTRPGQLTAAYLQGKRKPYLAPVPLFLVANVLFFALESMTGGTVFSTPLDSHLHKQPWSEAVRPLIERRLERMQTTTAAYAPQFDTAIAVHARSLILLMAISFTALPAIAFRRSRKPFAAHAVFSLHLYAFMLLMFCAGMLVLAALPWSGAQSATETVDALLSLMLVAVCAAYLYSASGRVYGDAPRARALKCAALTVGAAVIVLGYRFVLLVITIFTT